LSCGTACTTSIQFSTSNPSGSATFETSIRGLSVLHPAALKTKTHIATLNNLRDGIARAPIGGVDLEELCE